MRGMSCSMLIPTSANTAGLQLYEADVLKSCCVTMHGGSILESGHSEVSLKS